jgi:hypothetical protein
MQIDSAFTGTPEEQERHAEGYLENVISAEDRAMLKDWGIRVMPVTFDVPQGLSFEARFMCGHVHHATVAIDVSNKGSFVAMRFGHREELDDLTEELVRQHLREVITGLTS